MAVFSEVVGATVITRTGGVYRQVGVAIYDGRVFAKHGNGYVALHRDGGSSAPSVTWESLEGVHYVAKTGKTALYQGENK